MLKLKSIFICTLLLLFGLAHAEEPIAFFKSENESYDKCCQSVIKAK